MLADPGAADPATVHLLVSIDMLLYGGLIASRTSHDTTRTVLARLDVLREVRDTVHIPVWAYQVSGEYAMIEAAAANGWIDRRAAILESLLSIRRAGADAVLTYWATEAARWLRD